MKTEIAKLLLSIKAVFIRPKDPFIWASGLRSPIYCDCRLILSYPDARDIIEQQLAELIKKHYPDCEALMGTSTAGIPHAAIAAHILKIPMGYVRCEIKTHGRENQIEGNLLPNQKVVVIEDLLSTSTSAVDVVTALREAGAQVLGIASIFTYNMQGSEDHMKKNNVVNHSLCDLDTLIDVAVQEKYISEQDVPMVKSFRGNPSDLGWLVRG